MKYDCVRELNPIIGQKPTPAKMFAIKTAIMIPAIEYDLKRNQLTKKSIRSVNGFMAIVVANNHNVMNKAKRYCTKK